MTNKNLNRVSKKTLYIFLSGKKLTKVQGEVFHSDYWINESKEVLAYRKTSSWGGEAIYMIKEGTPYENQNTINIMSLLINNKTRL